MCDVLLVYPPHRIILGGRTYSPLGLPYIASILEKNGYTARILDVEIEKLDERGLIQTISKEKPGIIGVNVLTSALREAYSMITSIRKRFDVPIVVGGSHVTEVPEVVADLGVEYGIRGEGEYSMLALCEHLFNGSTDLHEVAGMVVNNEGSLDVSSPRMVEDLDALPNPARQLIPTGSYMFTTVMGSRGCPFNCIFCADPHEGVRHRSPESIIGEIEELVLGYGIRRIDFSDSVFTLNKDNVYRLCDLIEDSGFRFRWTCLTRVDTVDDRLLSRMRECGCFLIYFGVESGVEEVRYKTGKKISDDLIRHVFDYCHSIGISTGASAMFGFPGETIDDMKKTIDFVLELNPTYGVFSLPELMPGTQLFKTALQEGYATPDLWRRYMLGETDNLYYTPKGLSFQQLYDIDLEAHERFYYRLGYILGRIAGIRSKIELLESLDLVVRYATSGVMPHSVEMRQDRY